MSKCVTSKIELQNFYFMRNLQSLKIHPFKCSSYMCVIYMCVCVNTDNSNDGDDGGGAIKGGIIGGIMGLIFISALVIIIII